MLRFVGSVVGVVFALVVPASASAAGSISGTVTDESGTPIAGICVGTAQSTFAGLTFTETDENGEFVLENLAPANNWIVGANIAPCSAIDGDYGGEFYDDKPTFQVANHQTVVDEQNTALANDIELADSAPSTPPGSITGRVVDTEGDGISGICVGAGHSNGTGQTGTFTGPDGSFTLGNLAPASDWVVLANMSPCSVNSAYAGEAYDDQPTVNTATLVTVSSGSATALTNDIELGDPPPAGSIAGVVTDESTEQPLANICVSASSMATFTVRSTTTNGSGEYSISGLPLGDYKVRFDACGQNYVNEYFGDTPSELEAEEVAAGDDRADVDAALTPGATISGTVRSGPSSPLDNICVQAIGGNGLYTDNTNANGEYTIIGLPEASYTVVFSNCFMVQDNWAAQYYDGKARRSQADSFDLAAGGSRANVNATLIEGGKISGTVTGPDDLPVSGICVSATDESAMPNATGQTNVDGDYTLTGLSAGPHTVRFSDCNPSDGVSYLGEYYNDAQLLDDADPVSVTPPDETPDIDAELSLAGSVAGRLTLSGGAAAVGACVVVYPSSQIDMFALTAFAGFDSTDPSGEYEIGNLSPGSYRVAFGDCATGGAFPSAPSFAFEAHANQPTLAKGELVTVSGGAQTPVDAVVAMGGRIAGTVTDEDGTVSGLCVAAEDPSNGDIVAAAVTAGNGTYTLAGVPVGSWAIRYFTEGCSRAYSGDYLTEYHGDSPDRAGATLVSVTESTTTSAGTVTVASAPPDTTPPNTSITNGPDEGEVTQENDPSFAFDSNELGSSFECQLNNGPVENCTSPKDYTDLADATYTFKVTATDGNGNADPTPATRTFTVDTTAPETTITSGPAEDSTSADTTPSFAFTSNESGATFECQLNDAGYDDCTSGITLEDLDDGDYTFEVRASDAADNTDATPASRSWTVDAETTAPPVVEGTAPPNGTVTTDPAGEGPTPAAPVVAAVTTPTGGEVTITTSAPGAEPAGFNLLGTQLVIEAPDATVADPLRLTFTLDAASIPSGSQPSEIGVLRNGAAAGECAGSNTANPDPCVTSRTVLGNGDLRIVVLTSHASTWNLATVEQNTTPTNPTDPTPTDPTSPTDPTPPIVPGPGPAQPAADCVVPKLVGKKLAKAEKAIGATTCELGKVKKKAAKGKAGVVLKQKPKQGTVLPAGSPIDLTVSRKR
jgi:hypothetical protein